MKFLIVGCGSIGQRHLKNLIGFGICDFCVCDPDTKRYNQINEMFGGKANISFIRDTDEIGGSTFDGALICSPSSMHVQTAAKLLKRCGAIFIEKPISNTLDGIGNLILEAKKNNVISMMGMCYRFNPLILKLKEIINNGDIGDLYHSYICFGHYLPDWHPSCDYTIEYSARSDMGGGVLLTTGSHVLDLIRFLFGEIMCSSFQMNKLSGLDIDVDDYSCGMIRTEKNISVCCQFDFLSIPKTSEIAVVGSKGKINCNFVKEKISIFDCSKTIEFDFPGATIEMYRNEIRNFIDAIKNKKECECDFIDGAKTLEHLLKIKDMCNWRRVGIDK